MTEGTKPNGNVSGPRCPKNTSRSLSPQRFPQNAPRSPKKERTKQARIAAKESLLDSVSKLNPTIPQSPIRKCNKGTGGAPFKDDKESPVKSLSPKIRKETVGANKNLSLKLPTLNLMGDGQTEPLTEEMVSLNKPKDLHPSNKFETPRQDVRPRSPVKKLPREVVSFNGELPHLSPLGTDGEDQAGLSFPPKDIAWDPFGANDEVGDPHNTTKLQAVEEEPKKMPPKPRSLSPPRSQSAGARYQNQSATFARSFTVDDTESHDRPSPPPVGRTLTGERDGGQTNNSSEESSGVLQKSSIAENKAATPFRGRAQSILDHSLLGDSHAGLDMSVSDVDSPDGANPVASSAFYRQRLRAESLGESERSDLNHSRLSRNGSSRSASIRRAHSSVASRSPEKFSADIRKEMAHTIRRVRSGGGGSAERTESTARPDSPGRRKKASPEHRSAGSSRPKDGQVKKNIGGEVNQSAGSLDPKGTKSSVSPDRNGRRRSASARRARSNARSEESKESKQDALPEGQDSVESVSRDLNKSTGGNRAISHSPARPRGRAPGASFPSNTPRSVSPAKERSSRHRRTVDTPAALRRTASIGESPPKSRNASPSSRHPLRRTTSTGESASKSRNASPSSRHRRTVPKERSRHKRSDSPPPAREGCSAELKSTDDSEVEKRSAVSSQREMRKTHVEETLSHTPAPPNQKSVAPPVGKMKQRESLSLANVFYPASDRNDCGSDSSKSQLSEGIHTVVQFDPTNEASISSFKPAPSDPSFIGSDVFKMENLKNVKELDISHGSRTGDYVRRAMPVASENNAKPSSSQREGRRDAGASRLHSALNRSSRDGSRSRSRGPRSNRRQDRNRRESLRKRESLRIDQVFDDSSTRESRLDDSNLSNRSTGQNGESLSFNRSSTTVGSHETDMRPKGRRQRLRQKLLAKEQLRQVLANQDVEDMEEKPAYLPANMRANSPMRSLDNSENNSLTATLENDEEEEDPGTRRSFALSYVTKQLKSQANQIKDKVRSYRDQKSSSTHDTGGESEQEIDPYNKIAGKSESSMRKKLKGIFKSDKKKNAQLLGGSGSESDSSAY